MHPYSMNRIKKTSLALAALSAILLSACEDGAGPGKDEVKADLKELAGKVSTFAPPSGPKTGPKDALLKASARAKDCYNGSVDGVTIYETPATVEEPTAYWDTTWHYTAAGKPACDEADGKAYDLFASRSKDARSESWMKGRMDFGALAAPNVVKMSATGRVRYASNYEFKITAFNFGMSATFALSDFKLTLSLKDGRYIVDLNLAPGVGFEDDVPAGKIAMTGPIKKGASTVGYFEIMGDDRIVIRDEAKQVVSAQ
jgi:hypothetical protein